MGNDIRGLDADDQLFLLLQSMGYHQGIPLWAYQRSKRHIGMCPWCGESLHPGRKCSNDILRNPAE